MPLGVGFILDEDHVPVTRMLAATLHAFEVDPIDHPAVVEIIPRGWVVRLVVERHFQRMLMRAVDAPQRDLEPTLLEDWTHG